MRLRFNSLRFKIILASTLVEVLMLSLLMVNAMRLIDQSTRASTEAALKQAVPMLNVATAPYLVQGDYATLQDNLNEIVGNAAQGVMYAVVYNRAGKVAAFAGLAGIAEVAKLPPPGTDLPDARHGAVLHVERPLSLANQPFGRMRFGLSTSIVAQAREEVLRQSALIAVAEILLTTFLLGVLGYWLTRNLQEFVEGSRAIADGHYELRLNERGSDEVAKVARNFNRMGMAVEKTVGALRSSEQRYRELNEKLELRVEQRSEELRMAMSHLAETEKLASLGRIVAGVAHELNTPIGNVILMASTMDDQLTALHDALQGKAVSRTALHQQVADLQGEMQIVQRSAQRASELIESFKRITVDQTSQRRRPLDLHQTLEDIINTLGARIRRAGVTVELDVAPGITMDTIPSHLEQIFCNLVINSLVHGFEGRASGRIAIRAGEEQGWTEIVYEDNGCGIAAEARPNVFEPFYTSKMGQGGSGLGLFIVHNLVSGPLAGRVRLENVDQGGVRFIFHLPLRTPLQNI